MEPLGAFARYWAPDAVLGELVSEEEREGVEAAVQSLGDSFGASSASRPCHYMVYGHQAEATSGNSSSSSASPKRETVEREISMLRSFSERLVEKLYRGRSSKGSKIISIRILYAPPNCPEQSFHLDYGQAFDVVDTVLVSLGDVFAGNSTELLQWHDPKDAAAALNYARLLGRRLDCGALLRHLGKEPGALARVLPLATKAWGVWALRTSHCFHRRGPTFQARNQRTRVTLNIDVASAAEGCRSPRDLSTFLGKDCADEDAATYSTSAGSSSDEEGASQRGQEQMSSAGSFSEQLDAFVCVDTQRSLQSGRICGQDMIDDLDEQDICLHGDLAGILGCQ